jgi:transcriptional regulator with XRE-family HTH domain
VNEPKTFAETFKEIQKKKDISLTSVALGADMNVVSVRRVLRENDSPKLLTVIALATGLRLTIWDVDTIALLSSAGYKLSDLSFYMQSILEDWPANEGLRVNIDTLRMRVSLLILISSELLDAAPNKEILDTVQDLHLQLNKLASTATRLNRQLETYQGPKHSYSRYRNYPKPNEVE